MHTDKIIMLGSFANDVHQLMKFLDYLVFIQKVLDPLNIGHHL